MKYSDFTVQDLHVFIKKKKKNRDYLIIYFKLLDFVVSIYKFIK